MMVEVRILLKHINWSAYFFELQSSRQTQTYFVAEIFLILWRMWGIQGMTQVGKQFPQGCRQKHHTTVFIF